MGAARVFRQMAPRNHVKVSLIFVSGVYLGILVDCVGTRVTSWLTKDQNSKIPSNDDLIELLFNGWRDVTSPHGLNYY